MPKKKEPTKWETLTHLIGEYVEWCRADEMKGGGDPTAISEIEAGLELARVKLMGHIQRMIREEE